MAVNGRPVSRVSRLVVADLPLTGCAVAVCLLTSGVTALGITPSDRPAGVNTQSPDDAARRQFLDRYCVTCHNQGLAASGRRLDDAALDDVDASAEVWEKVVRNLRSGAMPPPGGARPDQHLAARFT